MLGITFTSETFERLLFKVEPQISTSRSSAPSIFATLRPHTSKKSNIIIISNGVEQKRNVHKIKRYVFSQDQFSEEKSQVIPLNHQKKHLVKKQRKQDPDYSVKKQKNDRNVISNIIHHLMKHCLTLVPDETYENILKKKQINLTVSDFRQLLEEKQKICRTYITNKHLKSLWDDGSQPQFSKAMRIVSRIFLQNYSFLTIFNGNKLNKQSKAIHYKGRRQLLAFLSKLK